MKMPGYGCVMGLLSLSPESDLEETSCMNVYFLPEWTPTLPFSLTSYVIENTVSCSRQIV